MIAGRLADGGRGDALNDMRAAAARLPETVTIPEQLMVRSLVAQAVCRICNDALQTNPRVMAAFVRFMRASVGPDRLTNELTALLDECQGALDVESRSSESAPPRTGSGCIDSVPSDANAASRLQRLHVSRVLEIIDARYGEPGLQLADVAQQIKLSVSHLAHLLKAHLGRSFVELLHHRRIAAAKQLLSESPLCVKEVAATVGYKGVTQFGRHYKRLCGSTPGESRGDGRISSVAAWQPRTPRSQDSSLLRRIC